MTQLTINQLTNARKMMLERMTMQLQHHQFLWQEQNMRLKGISEQDIMEWKKLYYTTYDS